MHSRTALTVLLTTALAAAAGPRRHVSPPEVVSSETLIDLRDSAQDVGPKNFLMTFELRGLLPKKRGRADFEGQVARVDGQWQSGLGETPGWNVARHEVDAGGLSLPWGKDGDGPRKLGRLAITLKPDRWKPEKPIELTVDLTGRFSRPKSSEPEDLTSSRFWKSFPRAQSVARELSGTWTATVSGAEEPRSGAFTARLSAPTRPGKWNMGAWDPEGKGLALRFDMGARQQNWNFARLAQYIFPEPRDLRDYSGLRVRIATEKPRSDTSVSIWLREKDGSWYYLRKAVPLIDRRNVGIALFEDFDEAEWVSPTNHMDEDYRLDLSGVTHLGVGITNPHGIGVVPMQLRSVELVKCRTEPLAPASAKVTGRMLSINGTQRVPPGLFGTYYQKVPVEWRPGCRRNLGGPSGPRCPKPDRTEAFLIDCWFDRYSTAVLLTSKDWKAKLTGWAEAYADRAKKADCEAHLEFWNEPYLNWARGRGAKNYQTKLFDVSKAEEGGPVTIKASGERFPLLRWRKRGGSWDVYDPTQFTYWSAKANAEIYNRMCEVTARAVKEANPEVTFIAGWGFRWHEDRWLPWKILYKPTIDRCWKWIDAIHEHHYQGDTTSMNGTYEVLVGYARAKYGKWLTIYNTETGDLVDAPARGAIDTPAKAKAARHYRKNMYNLRDWAYCLAQSPDKIKARTILIAGAKSLDAWEIAFRMTRNLRGRLVETACDDDDVWVVAAVDGTDPRAMPPGEEDPGESLVVLVFNEHRDAREVKLAVRAPQGTCFGGGTWERLELDRETMRLRLVSETYDAEPGAIAEHELHLEGRSAAKLTLPLTGELPKGPQAVREQFFSPDILEPVGRAEAFATTVELPDNTLREAKRAWLRIVVEDVAPAEGTVTVGERTLTLPTAWTADNGNRILELPVDPSVLSTETPVRFAVNDGNHAGYQVDAVSIVLERADD